MRTRIVCLLSAAVVLLGGSVALASHEYPTRLTIGYDSSAQKLRGRVISDVRQCKRYRNTYLERKTNGRWATWSNVTVNKRGRWVSPTRLDRGTWRVYSPEAVKHRNGHRITCLRDRSRSVTL